MVCEEPKPPGRSAPGRTSAKWFSRVSPSHPLMALRRRREASQLQSAVKSLLLICFQGRNPSVLIADDSGSAGIRHVLEGETLSPPTLLESEMVPRQRRPDIISPSKRERGKEEIARRGICRISAILVLRWKKKR